MAGGMIELVTDRRGEVERLCKEYRVSRLALFGSATRDDFDPESSDLDFLVEFLPIEDGNNFATYFNLREALMNLFSRKVDLVMRGAVSNPYLKRIIERTNIELYAA